MSEGRIGGQVTDDGQDFYQYCAHCDDSLTDGEWHPVATVGDDGTVIALYSFCDAECKTAWATEQ